MIHSHIFHSISAGTKARGDRTKAARAKGLYNADNTMLIKKSDENPMVLELYQGLLKGKEHKLLHNDFY